MDGRRYRGDIAQSPVCPAGAGNAGRSRRWLQWLRRELLSEIAPAVPTGCTFQGAGADLGISIQVCSHPPLPFVAIHSQACKLSNLKPKPRGQFAPSDTIAYGDVRSLLLPFFTGEIGPRRA